VIIDRVKDTGAPFYRPELPLQQSEDIQPGVDSLMKQCWAEEPSERPSFDAIMKSLKVINKGKSAFLFICLLPVNCFECFKLLSGSQFLKCPSARPYVHTSVRPQNVSSI